MLEQSDKQRKVLDRFAEQLQRDFLSEPVLQVRDVTPRPRPQSQPLSAPAQLVVALILAIMWFVFACALSYYFMEQSTAGARLQNASQEFGFGCLAAIFIIGSIVGAVKIFTASIGGDNQ
jgi:hypothetical protein